MQKGRADTKPIKKPDQLVDVEAELRRGVFGERRKQLLRRQKTLRRKFRREQLLRDSNGSKHGPRRCIKEMACDGILTENRQKWVEELNKHVQRSYTCDGGGELQRKSCIDYGRSGRQRAGIRPESYLWVCCWGLELD
eukprot:230213-Pyramimonas_sp.AAC.1